MNPVEFALWNLRVPGDGRAEPLVGYGPYEFWIDRRFVTPDEAVVKFYDGRGDIPLRRVDGVWHGAPFSLSEGLMKEVHRHLEDGDRALLRRNRQEGSEL